MNQTRYCQFKRHEGNPITYLCTYIECKLDSKWICVDCEDQQIHNHEQPNQNHLMKQQQFRDFITQQCLPILIQKQEDKRLIQIWIKELQNLIQSAQFLIQRLQEDLADLQKYYNLEEIEQIIKITNDNYFLLENEQIEKIINLNYYNENFKYNLSEDVLKWLIKIDEDLQKLLENNFNKQNVQIKQEIILDNQIIQQNTQLVYQRHFEYKQKFSLQTSQISYEEKYLVFGGYDRKIQVYDILTKQMIYCVYIDHPVLICRFTKDSKYLICGDSHGYLYWFDINNYFKQKYKKQIHSYWIRDILPINNDQIITCSDDKNIIITNMKQKTQQLIIKNTHNSSINTVDFDQQNNVIISGSSDKSIRFLDKNTGIMQFEKEDAHDKGLLQIQLVSDQNYNLLSSGWTNLILWQIDYHNRQLNKIKVLEQIHCNFTSIANNNRIILITTNDIQILDQNFSLVQSINHNLNLEYVYKTKQINSMNYILLLNCQPEREMLILKRT